MHVKVDVLQMIDALGPFVALDPAFVGPFLAKSSSMVSTQRGMPLYELAGNTAIITIEGALARKADFFWGILWLDGYDRIEQAVEKATKDDDVETILFRIESPGGAAQGLGETGTNIRSMLEASKKTSIASMGLAASAGYWLATIADEQYVDADGAAGSIGTYLSHYDLSRALDKAGITITHIQDPDGKTAGTWTKPLDEEGKARFQEAISMLSQSFYDHVGQRRGIAPESVRGLNAKVFYGKNAVEAKLADGVMSFSQAKKRAGELAQKRKIEKMSELASFLGLGANASAEDIKKAADEAKSLLGLGRKALALTGESSAESANGVLVAWKKDASDAAALRADAAQAAKENDAKERHSLLVALAQVEPPSHVWANTSDLSKGAVQELAEMSTASLRAYVERRTNSAQMPALRKAETKSSAEVSDADVKAYMKEHGIKSEAVARAALARAQEEA